MQIPLANGLVVLGDYAYIGQNKMITKIDLSTGDREFFTNKSEEELEALEEMYE